MKKILTVALVALLAAGTAFAGFSGNANIKLGYDFTSGKYGFENGTGFDVNLDVATAAGEKKGEGDVYAGIKASVALTLGNYKYKEAYSTTPAGDKVWTKDGDKMGIGAFFKLAEAYVAGQDWKVAITSSTKAVDLAKSAIDTKKDD
ncbi:MAG: hypothetical protein SPJ34_08630, partial [Candidatus Ornithospirochaeta sp.]|nr:hypothetical protein [Candidatus Ornithospirochaeta sp.]